jgi:hypothetical protein
MALRSCDVCDRQYDAKRPSSRFCGATCRKRNQRSPEPAAAPALFVAPASGLSAATAAELEAAGRLETSLGQAALVLARRVDGGDREPGSALASLVREHRASLAEALRGAQQAASPLDEVKARRDRKLAG